ncbi:hypothetical protein NXV51_11645 [Bacteroides uniformis]|nr:hypothetical protein [Bacteroides uniformis]
MMPEEKQWETIHGQMIFVYMRVEEMYLINAEANARANHLPEAKALALRLY